MAAADPLTTITVHSSTLKVLQYYKLGGESWDDVMTKFIEDHPPEAFLKEMARRVREERSYPIERLIEKSRRAP